MKVALCQINSSGDIDSNLALVEENVRTAAAEGAGPDDLAPLCDELVELAQQLERLR